MRYPERTLSIIEEAIVIRFTKKRKYVEDITFLDTRTRIIYTLSDVLGRSVRCVDMTLDDSGTPIPRVSIVSAVGIRYLVSLHDLLFTRTIESAPLGLRALYEEYADGGREAIEIDEEREFLYYARFPLDFPRRNIVEKKGEREYAFVADRREGERTATSFVEAGVRYLDEINKLREI